MFRNIVILSFALAFSVGLQQPAYAQDDLQTTLDRAEALYFEAKFSESIQLLSKVNETLQGQPGRVKEKISTKFQLALANIGLNNATAAKSFLMEIYALDPEFSVDAQQYSPKVVTLANEAKADQNTLRCKNALQEARKGLAGGDAPSLLSLFQSMKSRCVELAAVAFDAADLVYRKGLAVYRQDDLPGALENFRAALSLNPKHELAAQYLELTENKIKVSEDRVLLDWLKNFQMHQYDQAGAAYRQVASSDDPGSVQLLSLMATEYRKVLAPLVDSWNQACTKGDSSTMNEIKNQISQLIPEPSFGTDVRSKMVPCTPPTPAPAPAATNTAVKIEPTVAPPSSPPSDLPADVAKPAQTACFQMASQLALLRLKQRVEPTFSPQALAYLQNAEVTVLVKLRVAANGSVSVIDASGANVLLTTAVRTAVEAWKFNPAFDEKGPRCVDTEIPIVISRK